MSKKRNKRYIVYRTYDFRYPSNYTYDSFYWRHHCKFEWYPIYMTRDQLVLYAAQKMRDNDNPFFDRLVKDMTQDLDRYAYVPCEGDRLGIKNWRSWRLDYYCIKTIKDGKEVVIDYNALLKDANRVRQSLDKPKHYNWSYKYHKSWKRQYKVKHQYEIHLDPHEDRGYFNKRKYDEEMLLDVI